MSRKSQIESHIRWNIDGCMATKHTKNRMHISLFIYLDKCNLFVSQIRS